MALYKKVLHTGKIYRNWLEDFPQHLLTEPNKYYELVINENLGLQLYFDFNTINPNRNITLPFAPITDKFDCIIDWGDGETSTIIGSDKFDSASHIYSDEIHETIITITGTFYRI